MYDQLFDSLDKDGGGEMDYKELTKALQSGRKLSPPMLTTKINSSKPKWGAVAAFSKGPKASGGTTAASAGLGKVTEGENEDTG